ncbi:MAG: DoxX family protein [Terriglobales bacterium]
MKAAFLIGRAMLGGFFVYNGINHFRQADALAQYAASKNVPAAKAAVLASGAAMLFGGASLITGIKPKWGALAIIGFLASVSPTIHDFWNIEDPQQRQNEMINFWKNMALAGATLALAGVDEPWEVSVPVLQPSGVDRAKQAGRKVKRFGEWLAA